MRCSATHERLAGYAAGADHYLTKPFDEELLAVARVLLRRSGRQAA